MDKSSEVLIVGAGPVGMLLALELKLAGIKPTIISKPRPQTLHSKATIIWPRLLELLDRTSITPKLVEHGHCFHAMNYYSNHRLVGSIRMTSIGDTNFPFAVAIPQWKTELYLEEELERQGVSIRYDRELVHLSQTETNVTATIKSGDGTIIEHTTDWLVGADGFHSRVRDVAGFDYSGYELPTRLAITDTEIRGDTASNELAYYLHRSGNLVTAPLGDGLFRIGVSVPGEAVIPREPDRAFFENLLQERAGGKHSLGQMRFSGVFKAYVKSAHKFVKGRVVLAGDAAHVMSPSGAQGLNTGFQDAVSLGWRLAGLVSGVWNDSVLEEYGAERKQAVNQVSQLSTRLAKISLYTSPIKILARDVVLSVATSTGLLDRILSPRIAQMIDLERDEHPYKTGQKLKEGGRMPLGWRTTGSDVVLSKTEFTMLLWPGHSYYFRKWSEFVSILEENVRSARVVDLGGRPLGPLLNILDEPVAALVRPDGMIERVASILGPDKMTVAHMRSHMPAYIFTPSKIQKHPLEKGAMAS